MPEVVCFGSPKDYLTFLKCLLNHGKYNGGQLLKPETVHMTFKNELPDHLSIDYELPDTLAVMSRRFLDESDKHGLAWAIEDNNEEKIRPKGTGYWGQAAINSKSFFFSFTFSRVVTHSLILFCVSTGINTKIKSSRLIFNNR